MSLAASGNHWSQHTKDPILPYHFQVSSPYPNPFNPNVSLDLHVPYDRRMDIRVFDILGNEIDIISDNIIYEFGSHKIYWSSDEYSSGIYYIRFLYNINFQEKKLTVIK